MRFIHTADHHLNVSLSHASFKNAKAHDTRLYELKDTFFKILRHADEKNVDALLIAGDLFDNASIKIHELESIFERLNALECEVFLLIGNHDVFLHEPPYQSLLDAKNIHVFSKDYPSHDFGETTIHGINTKDFSPEHLKRLNESLDTSRQNILMLHGDILNKQDDHHLTTLKMLEATDFDYIALGHIHKPAFLRDHIAYCGNPEPLDFSESDERGYIEGTLSNKHLSTAFRPVQKRRFLTHTIKVTEEETIDDIREKMRTCAEEDSRERDFHRIVLKGTRGEHVDIDTDKLTQYLIEDFHYVEIRDETEVAFDYAMLKQSYKDTLISVLIEEYEAMKSPNEEDEAALNEALRALLETEGSQ